MVILRRETFYLLVEEAKQHTLAHSLIQTAAGIG